ncbi:MAG: UvrD-helicase domain-containing protein [Paludibacteraceae bacterium]|nr:UvrD-helicase domain-containing protein [Paludibacteraceae bacterium]
MDFLEQLNASQREAVTYTDGPSLIVAGAGSGKTRVLTYKIAYLLQQGVPAVSVMALTFTNKAAREMRERIYRLVPAEDARYLWMGTFHSICTRLLRPEAERLGYTRDFSIYDTPDSKSLLKTICKERGLDEKIYKPSAVQSRISMLKNMMISPDEYGKNQQLLRQDREARMYELYDVYRLYQIRLKESNAMDFDDLLLKMLFLLRLFPEVREKYQQAFRYILVDEYQDTNYVQYLLCKELAAPQNNITVVGDDAQSIYSFRGADIRNILNFQQTYAGARLFKLERNYRSTQNIVNAANSLIQKNQQQIRKQVYSENEAGQPLALQMYMSDRDEAIGIAEAVQTDHRRSKVDFDDIAILYRTNAQSRAFEGELRKRSIPYRIYGGTSFYQRKEIKDAIGYFRLAVNPRDNESLLRVVGFPGRGIGDTTMRKVSDCAVSQHIGYLEVMRTPDEKGLEVNAGTKKKLVAFAGIIDTLREESETMDAFSFAEQTLKQTGVLTALAMDRSPEGIDRAQNVQELLNAIQEFVMNRANEGIDFTPITDFLSEVSLLTDQDDNLTDTTSRVTLMTVHAAKGLEFKYVYIVGMEENLFPSQFCVKPSEIEEERRLLYVAITRAMERCQLSYARQRFRNGQVAFSSPSRFLKDIDRQYFEISRRPVENKTTGISTFRPIAPPSAFSVPSSASPVTNHQSPLSSDWKTGDRVSHRVFGEGTVVRVYRDEITENDKIEIKFDTAGTKTLLLTHARLERM